jgi:RNA polymerase sigma factor (sigma-70 family)
MISQQMNITTSSLLTDFTAGDDNAFATLYDSHIIQLLNYGSYLTQDKELLKDCIHDIFIKIYNKRSELSSIDNFKSYLFISLKNRIFDEMRRQVFMSDTPVEEIIYACDSDNVENKYIQKEKCIIEKKMVANLISQLSPRQQEALTMYYLEGKKYDEICLLMNMNYQSVRNLMHRGILRLRELAI